MRKWEVMQYSSSDIAETEIPRATAPALQHILDTYASETNKVLGVWRAFSNGDSTFRPDGRSSSVAEIMKHQLLSERRFFGEFLGSEEPAPHVLPEGTTPEDFVKRMLDLARPRLSYLARQDEDWWLGKVKFFDVERDRFWVFWRRVLHTAHHRTQLTVYLRLLEKPVPSTYGPTADVTWDGADPTTTVDAAGRR